MSSIQISILTLNIAGLPSPPAAHLRIREFARLVNSTDVSLINLQELHTYGLLWELRTSLKIFKYISYKPSVIGPKAGLVTLSKFPIATTHVYGTAFHKGALITKLTNGVVVCNAHLLANTDGDWSKQNRFYSAQAAQMSQLQAICAQYGNAEPCILTGDFNLAKTSDLYDGFREKGKWNDVFNGENRPTFHQEFLPAARKPQCIDYILYRGSLLKPEESRYLFANKVVVKDKPLYLSNHAALQAKFFIGR